MQLNTISVRFVPRSHRISYFLVKCNIVNGFTNFVPRWEWKFGILPNTITVKFYSNFIHDYFRWYFLNKSSVSCLVSNNSLKNSMDKPAPLNLGGGYSLSSFSQSIKSNFAISTNEIGLSLYFIITSSGLFLPLSVEIVIGYYGITDDFIKQDPKE